MKLQKKNREFISDGFVANFLVAKKVNHGIFHLGTEFRHL